jgi:hypothetical protein
MSLPNFSSPSLEELRALWKRYRGNPDVERLILEVKRTHDVLLDVEDLYSSIEQAWRNEGLGHLVALYKLRILVLDEKARHGVLKGLPVPSPSGSAKGSGSDQADRTTGSKDDRNLADD